MPFIELPLSLGYVFFTDHLKGDHYFKADYSGHNLKRALVQFRLVEDIEENSKKIEQIVFAL